jgi:signal transduction histidine kinase
MPSSLPLHLSGRTRIALALRKALGRLEAVDVRVFLCAFAILLIAGLWIFSIAELNNTKAAELRMAARDAESFARLFKEHATRTIEAADQTTVYLRHRFDTVGMRLNIAQDLKEGLAPDDIYNLFSIADDKGNVVLASKPFAPTNLADREHFRVHAAADNIGLYISKPILGRVSNHWSLQMTRRINHGDGSFKGVVVVSMNPEYFTDLYNEIDIGKFGSISLIGTDGIVRVRHSGYQNSMGRDASNSENFKAMQGRSKGVQQAFSSVDKRERIYAYEKLNRYPLYVTVGIDVEERLQAYRENRFRVLLLACLVSLMILLFTSGLIILINHLVASRKEALVARKAKLHFLSNMSHELRTPLSGILGYSETLMEDFSGTRHGEYATAIHDSGQRLLSMVDAVLEVSTLRSGKVGLSQSEEKISDLATHAISRHKAAAARKKLQIAVEIALDVPELIHCDRTKLLQVLDKLLDNAVRFTEQGSVVLRIERGDEQLIFHVIDTGPGIPLAAQDKIFEKFAQVDDSPARSKDGVGLGLTIGALLVELMQGKISIKSVPQQGSTFTFTLPLKQDVE